MKTIEIIRNSVMQCIERIAKLSKIVEKVDNSLKLQEQNIENGKVYDSVMSNFVTSQFNNFTYLYYAENGLIKSILFNDGNVDKPNVPNYTISGKPVSYRCHNQTSKVVFKDFDTSAVTNMSSMFANKSHHAGRVEFQHVSGDEHGLHVPPMQQTHHIGPVEFQYIIGDGHE